MKDKIIEKTINHNLKRFGLKIKQGLIYKGQYAIHTLSLDETNQQLELYSFLEGYSSGRAYLLMELEKEKGDKK